jgi:hypothetical protein
VAVAVAVMVPVLAALMAVGVVVSVAAVLTSRAAVTPHLLCVARPGQRE